MGGTLQIPINNIGEHLVIFMYFTPLCLCFCLTSPHAYVHVSAVSVTYTRTESITLFSLFLLFHLQDEAIPCPVSRELSSTELLWHNKEDFHTFEKSMNIARCQLHKNMELNLP